MWVKLKLVAVCFKIALILVQDWCKVCAECTMGMEIALGIPVEVLGDVSQMEAHFSLFGDSVNLNAR
jgi:hypothetical protein